MTGFSADSSPLPGIRILDISEGIAGPYATSLLGDMGAEVIKVERADGDWGRNAGRTLAPDLSAMYVAMNRNKRGVGLDLKSPPAIEVVRRIIDGCDVLVSNFRPGAMDRLGLSYEDCLAIRPGLVYCTISAFDTRGPYAELGGNDTGLQAISGFMSMNGMPDSEPVRAASPVIDMTAALFVVQAILGALRLPEGAPGRRIEVSLLNAAVALQTLAYTEYLNTGDIPKRQGNQNPFISPAGAFAGADGRYFTVSCLKESHWRRLCEVIGRQDLVDDPDYRTGPLRVANRANLNAILDGVFAARPATEWVQLLREHEVLCAAINELDQVVSDPGLGDTMPIVDIDGPGSLRTIGHPVRFGGDFMEITHGPEVNGIRTREILAEFGYVPEEIDELIRSATAHAEQSSSKPTGQSGEHAKTDPPVPGDPA